MSVVSNEQRKLTAAHLNTMDGGLFTAGVAVPIADAVFGFTRAGMPVGALILGRRIHDLPGVERGRSSRRTLRSEGGETMTDVQVVGFIITPLMALAFVWGIAIWARNAD